MDEVLFNEQDNYDLNGYDENIVEDEMYDDDLYEDEDYYDEDEEMDEDYYDDDEDEDYYDDDDEDEEMGEARGRRMSRRKRNRRKKQLSRLGFPNSSYSRTIRRPKKRNYFKPRPSNRPVSSKKVVKAFDVASRDIQKTKAAVGKVNYKNKRQNRVIRSQSKRIKGNEYALAAKTVITELSKEFPIMTANPLVNVITQSVPGMFQKSQYQKFLKDPRKMTPIIIGAIGLFKEFQSKKGNGVQNVSITPPVMNSAIGRTFSFSAFARDSNGNTIPDKILTWFSNDESIATVVPDTGVITGISSGNAKIYAQEISTGITTSADVNIT